jgi:predicted  nucleic acid-binding Zn-ribbon protein
MMNISTTIAKQAVQDKLESQIKLAEARLHTLKAQAENAKANVEIKAIADLAPKKQSIQRKLQELKKSSGEAWNHAKTDLETHITEMEKLLKGIESKVKAH